MKKMPFRTVYEFTGSLSKEGLTAKNLHIVIQHSDINPDIITGKVVGNNETYKEIHPIFKKSPIYISLESDDKDYLIQSDNVIINNLSYVSYPRDKKESIPFDVAKFSMLSIRTSKKIEEKEPTKKITYYLAGPEIISVIFPYKYKKLKKPLSWKADKNFLGTFNQLKVYVVKHDLQDDYNGDAILEKSVVALQFEYDITKNEMPDDIFIEKSKNIIDDILLLASFICNHWIKWYGYTFQRNNIIQNFHRVTRIRGNPKMDIDDIIVDLKDIKQFFRRGFRKFNKLRKEEFDIRKPMIYIINGNEASYVEAQFTTTFLALEKLKHIYAIKKNIDKNLKPSKFKKIRSKISKLINEEIEDSENIIEKLPDLNRPPIQFIFSQLMDEYNVGWSDLYPINSELTLFKTRNNLFHSVKHPSFETIFKEFKRLQILLDRILLKILRWNKTSSVYHTSFFKYLTK